MEVVQPDPLAAPRYTMKPSPFFFGSLLFCAFGIPAGLAQATAPETPVLIAFDLRTDPEGDIEEAVPHTKTTILHPMVDLTQGLQIGVLQKGQNTPGLLPRNSTVTWVFYGLGNGSSTVDGKGSAGDDKAANSLASAIANNLYFGFIVAPKPGYGLNLSSATLTIAHSFAGGGKQTGPTHSAVLTSATGFSEDQALGVTTEVNNKVATYELSHPGLTTITSPVEFRIYCWRPDGNATEGSGLSLRQNPGIAVGAGGNVVLTGEVFKLNGD